MRVLFPLLGLLPAATAAAGQEAADPLRTERTFAERGFVATRADPRILRADGAVAFDLSAHNFLSGDAPATVHPQLWAQSALLAKHGLFRVAEGIWQVRGFDIANATFVAGRSGWIVIDPLMTAETARAALDLVNSTLGERRVRTIVYTHSHVDHFGGAVGMVRAGEDPSAVRVIAPKGFAEGVAADLLTGAAGGRRSAYQFGTLLAPGPAGRVGAGAGAALPRGTVTYLRPTEEVAGEVVGRDVDGVSMVFQLTPDTEAPAEMNIHLPAARVLHLAENGGPTMHNLLPLRGAPVRDARAWGRHLDAALTQFGESSDVVVFGHGWPRFGRAEVADFLARHRDAYLYLHDQSVRMMNQGLGADEIAERLELPPALARPWYNRSHYGNLSFNARAVYQRYLGSYDGNPAYLAPLPRGVEAQHLVQAIGGPARTMAAARRAVAAGEFTWGARLLDALLRVAPQMRRARALLAATYRRMGEAQPNAVWRNAYLTAAQEVERGVPAAPPAAAGGLLAAMPMEVLLDLTAVRIDGARAAGQPARVAWRLTDGGGAWLLVSENGVLRHRPFAAGDAPEVTVMGPKAAFIQLFLGGAQLPALLERGDIRLVGDRGRLETLLGFLERPRADFPVVP